MEICEILLTNNYGIYLLDIQCTNVFNYICFNAFRPFLRELSCVAYRLAASVIVNKSPIKPDKALSTMAAPCVESSSPFEHLLIIYRDAVLVKLWPQVL